MKKHLPPKEWDYKWCFDDVPPEDLALFKPLTEDYSSELWEKFVSKRNRHGMLLDHDEFNIETFFKDNWVADWKNDTNRVWQILQEKLDFPESEEVLIFWMKERGLKAPWSMFLKYWRDFLYVDNEYMIVLSEKHPKTIIFGPALFFIGKRNPKV